MYARRYFFLVPYNYVQDYPSLPEDGGVRRLLPDK